MTVRLFPLTLLLLTACARPSSRDQAALRGLHFLKQIASNPEHFKEYGDDLMWAFYSLSEAAADPELKRQSRDFGHTLALQWRAAHPKLPADAGVNRIYNYGSASLSADLLGVPDEAMRADLDRAARRFKPADLLGFDPAKEPPPNLDALYDALIATYSAKRYGVWFGGELADVLGWFAKLRPHKNPSDELTYLITHVIYVLNDYDRYRLDPAWLPQEFAYLKAFAERSIESDNAEILGEFIDTLQVFGVPDSDPLIRRGIDYLLAHQNADGSWGDVNEKDIYTRYHTTWTGIGGVMHYAWKEQRVTDEEALRRLRTQ